jgi:hypothetical protein
MLHITNNSFISGIVVDEYGKQSICVSVVQLITAGKNEDAPWFDRRPSISDDGFRFERISPGEYQLSFNYGVSPSEDMPYPTWFYPGTLDRTKATVLRIEEGSRFRR